jgi:hypothetical protein
VDPNSTTVPAVVLGSGRKTRSPPETRGAASGQSLVEFSLIVPIMMVLAIGFADLGRVFVAAIMTESAARDAAEIAAQQYLKDYPLEAPSPVPPGYYADLHQRAARAVCAELKSLPNTNFTGGEAGDCSEMPIVLACVHDGTDDSCAIEPFGDAIPAGCSELLTAPSPALPGGTETSRFVEVRVCYKFTPLTHSLLFVVPEIYLQQTRVFTVADY